MLLSQGPQVGVPQRIRGPAMISQGHEHGICGLEVYAQRLTGLWSTDNGECHQRDCKHKRQ